MYSGIGNWPDTMTLRILGDCVSKEEDGYAGFDWP